MKIALFAVLNVASICLIAQTNRVSYLSHSGDIAKYQSVKNHMDFLGLGCGAAFRGELNPVPEIDTTVVIDTNATPKVCVPKTEETPKETTPGAIRYKARNIDSAARR